MIKEVKNIVPWTYATNDLNGEEIIGTFYQKELQKKKKQQKVRTEKVIKRKGYGNSFNSWIDKNDV